MNEFKTLLDMDIAAGVMFCVVVIAAATFLIQKWDWIVSRFGIVTKRKLAEERRGAEIDEIKEQVKANGENVDKIFAYMDEIRDSVKQISAGMDNLQHRVDQNEVSKLSDRITQSYRYYKDKRQWTTMEKWAFENLVDSYMRSGGDSFVDTKVIPASKDWVIKDEW